MNDVSETSGSDPVKGSLEFCGFQNSNNWWFTESLYSSVEGNKQFWDHENPDGRKFRIL